MQFCSLQLSFKPPHPERLLHTPFPGISLQTCSKYAIKHTNPNTAHETRLTNFSANPPANNPTDRQKGKKKKTRIPVHRCFSSKKASPRTLSLGSWESKSQAQNNCNTCSLLINFLGAACFTTCCGLMQQCLTTSMIAAHWHQYILSCLLQVEPCWFSSPAWSCDCLKASLLSLPPLSCCQCCFSLALAFSVSILPWPLTGSTQLIKFGCNLLCF